MKITIATGPIFPVPAVRGGAVQRLWEGLAREFIKRGHEVTIFAREFPGQARKETVDGIRYVRRGGYEQSTSIKRDLLQCLLYALKAARHVPPGDVVVTNDFWMPAVLPWVNPRAGKVIPCLQRFPKKQCGLYGRCSALVAVSQAVANAVKTQSPSVAYKVVAIPNAVDEVFLRKAKRPRDEETKSRSEAKTARGGDEGKLKDQGAKGLQDYGTAEAKPRQVAAATNGPRDQEPKGLRDQGTKAVRILYVGRIHPEKGVGLLVQALNSMRHTAYGRRQEVDWECGLVGPVKESEGGGGEAFAEQLKRQANGLPVRFEAPVYDPVALAKIYDQADVFVYPSVANTGEAMPLAPVEAMARGLVPVVSGLDVFREYLRPDVNGVVFDHRSDNAAANLASVLGELVEDAAKREQLAPAARATAEHFSTAAIADKYLQLFQKVISGRW